MPRALRPPDPETLHDVDRRLHEVRAEVARAMVRFGVGTLDPRDYAIVARDLKDEEARLSEARRRMGAKPWT